MSKFGNLQSDPDPFKVTVIRKHTPANKTLKSQSEINAAQRRGEKLDTSKKYFAGSNRQHKVDMNTARLDEETEELKHEHVPLELGKIIQQARNAKEWNQKVRLYYDNLIGFLGLEHPH
jgi:putative transcription factor